MFTAASDRLYHASRQYVYWKEITILVPASWSRQSQYGVAKTESFETANIIVHDHDDNEPYVDNPSGCGKEGLDLHLTPKFITDETYREDKFGATGKSNFQMFLSLNPPGGGGGVLRFGSDGGVPLKPPNPYLSLRVILAEKGTHYLGFLVKKMVFLCTLATKRAKISSIYTAKLQKCVWGGGGYV